MDIVALGALTGLSVTVFVVPLLWFLPQRAPWANRFLALFVLVVGISMLQTFLLHSGLIFRYPGLSALGQFFYFALGPLLYCYTRAQTDRGFVFPGREGWHFLPVLISFAAYLPVYFESPAVKLQAAQLYFSGNATTVPGGWSGLEQPAMFLQILLAQYIVLMIHLAAYAVLTLWQLKKHLARIELEFSNLELIDLNWMRVLNWLVLASSVASLIYVVMRLQVASMGMPELRVLPVLVLTALVYYAGWMGVRQPQIYGEEKARCEPLEPLEDEDSAPKYQATGLSADDAQQKWQVLQQFMHEERPYLRTGLTIRQLAEELGLSVAHLSQIINSHANANFFEYINTLRIEYSQRLLESPEGARRKVLDIALSSGFNSQSTYYAQFRKRLGMTPNQYRDRFLKNP